MGWRSKTKDSATKQSSNIKKPSNLNQTWPERARRWPAARSETELTDSFSARLQTGGSRFRARVSVPPPRLRYLLWRGKRPRAARAPSDHPELLVPRFEARAVHRPVCPRDGKPCRDRAAVPSM